MCFTGEMSAGFAVVGLFMAWWINHRTCNRALASGVFFFFLMEALQAVQYVFISTGLTSPTCGEMINKVLTGLGFLHICLQPYYTHVINHALCQQPSPKFSADHNKKLEKYHSQYEVIKRLCLIGGFLLFLRWPMAYISDWDTLPKVTSDDGLDASREWIRGDQVCTFKTNTMVHLGWSIPMADATYFIQGIGIHVFLMFAPFFALYQKKGMITQGIFLFLTGPVAAAFITRNLMEQASVWCFFSIAQIATMLFLIRETLLINWGKGNTSMSLTSKAATDSAVEAPSRRKTTPKTKQG